MSDRRLTVADNAWWQARLQRLGGAAGIIVGFAFDHRNSMSRDLQDAGMPADDVTIAEFKREVIAALAPRSTLVLLDHQYGLAAVAHGQLPGGAVFAMPLEARRPSGAPFWSATRLMEEWTAHDARAAGAQACKLLLPLRMDHPEHAQQQLATCRSVVEQCHAAELVPIIEPVAWPDVAAPANSPQLGSLAVAGAQAVSAIGDLIAKVQHPGPALLQKMNEVCAPNPWVLLGGGAPSGEITREVSEATAAGASGFLVGRTLFRPALRPDPVERAAALRNVSGPLIDELARLARVNGRPLPRTRGTHDHA